MLVSLFIEVCPVGWSYVGDAVVFFVHMILGSVLWPVIIRNVKRNSVTIFLPFRGSYFNKGMFLAILLVSF